MYKQKQWVSEKLNNHRKINKRDLRPPQKNKLKLRFKGWLEVNQIKSIQELSWEEKGQIIFNKSKDQFA